MILAGASALEVAPWVFAGWLVLSVLLVVLLWCNGTDEPDWQEDWRDVNDDDREDTWPWP